MENLALRIAERQSAVQLNNAQISKSDNSKHYQREQVANRLNSSLILPSDKVVIQGQEREMLRSNWPKYYGLEMMLNNQLRHLTAIKMVMKDTVERLQQKKEVSQGNTTKGNLLKNRGILA